MMDAMRRRREGGLTRVRIGTGSVILTSLLPPVLRVLRREHPSIELVITTGTSDEISAHVAQNTVDIGLVVLPIPEQRLIMHVQNALLALRNRTIELSGLAQRRVAPRSELLMSFDRKFRETGSSFRSRRELPGSCADRHVSAPKCAKEISGTLRKVLRRGFRPARSHDPPRRGR
jgi:DNA-binding transcriptional LysR family regulator